MSRHTERDALSRKVALVFGPLVETEVRKRVHAHMRAIATMEDRIERACLLVGRASDEHETALGTAREIAARRALLAAATRLGKLMKIRGTL